MLNQNTRAYIYRILLALAPIAVAYGFVTASDVGLWVVAAEAVLGLGLATANTPLGKHRADGDGEH